MPFDTNLPFFTAARTRHTLHIMKLSGIELETAGREVVRSTPQAFFDIDLEADGIAGMGSILSIGAVSPWGDEFYAELCPMYDRWIPDYRAFTDTHGLSRERLVAEGQDPSVAIRGLARWVEVIVRREHKEAAVFTSFNASYDFPLLNLYMYEMGIENPFGFAGFCIKSLAISVAGGRTPWDWKATSKSRLPRDLVPDEQFTHNALEDARFQQRIHYRLAGLLGGMSLVAA